VCIPAFVSFIDQTYQAFSIPGPLQLVYTSISYCKKDALDPVPLQNLNNEPLVITQAAPKLACANLATKIFK
jgi:hypothetical protein